VDDAADRLAYFSPHSLVVGARASGCLTCEFFRGQWSGGHGRPMQSVSLPVYRPTEDDEIDLLEAARKTCFVLTMANARLGTAED